MADGRDPRGAMDVDADVALVGDERRPGVEADPNPDRAGRERLCASRQRPRALPERVGKAKKKASPCVSTSTPPSRGERLAKHAAMLGERIRVRLRAELVQQPRRALDVREEEGDGAGREIGSHAT